MPRARANYSQGGGIIYDMFFVDGVDPRLFQYIQAKFEQRENLKKYGVVRRLEITDGLQRELQEQEYKLAKLSVWHRIADFVGLPVSMDEPNIIKNLFGWHDSDAPALQKGLNYTGIKPALTLAFNLVMMPLRFAKNILKLCLHVLPALISFMSVAGALIIFDSAKNDIAPIAALKYLASALLGVLGIAASIVGFLGASLVSPVSTAQDFWQTDRKGLAVLSGIVSIALYAVLFPLAIHFLLPVIAAQAAIYLPVLAVNALSVLSTAGTAVSAAIGALTLGVGSAITVLAEKFSHWYRSLKQPVERSKPILLDDDSDSDHVFDKNYQPSQGASLALSLSQDNDGVSSSSKLDQSRSLDEESKEEEVQIADRPKQPVSQDEEVRQARLKFFSNRFTDNSPDAGPEPAVGFGKK